MRPAVLYTLVMFSSGAFSQSFLDPGFADNGVFVQSLSDQSVDAFDDLAITGDGGVIAIADGSVFKLTQSGVLDEAFGSNGIALISMAGAKLILDSEGSIYIAGSSYIDFMNRACIAKLMPTGAIDPSFGDQGLVVFMDLNDARFTEIVLAPGNSVRVGGSFFFNNSYEPIVAQIDANGTLVSGFGANGTTTLDHLPFNSHIVDLTAMSSDRLLVSCRTPHGYLVTLLQGNAEPASSFGNGGILSFDEDADLTGCALDQSGIILMGTTTTFAWDNTVQCRRFDQSGALDQSFGTDGTATIDPGSTIRAGNARPCPTQDGGIVLVGTGIRISGWMVEHPYFCGLNADGTVNTSIGVDGVMLDTINTCQGSGAMFANAAGLIYCWGGTSPGTDADAIITRYHATPVGIVESTPAPNWFIWPQPVIDYLYVIDREKQGERSFDVLDVVGRRVLGFVGDRSPTMSFLSSGTYILVESGTGQSRQFLKD